MKAGDTVTIYEDYMTEKKEEGKAELVEFVKSDAGVGAELWYVHFLADDSGDKYQRWIKWKGK